MIDFARACRWAPVVLVLLGPACGDDDRTGSLPATLDPMGIPKFVAPLVVPAEMPPVSTGAVTEYRIAVRQFQQQVLPSPMPPTTVWGYGSDSDSSTFSYPGRTIETRSGQPVRVTWINELTDENGNYLSHLLPVDTTIHWANPSGQPSEGEHEHDHDHDHHDNATQPARYTGPVPIVTHVHGAHSFDHSDGHPEAWFLPAAANVPAGFATRGPTYQTQADAGEGAAVFDYPLDEDATTLWYHDHTLGMTRVNIYAGLAGVWVIRDAVEDALGLPGPAPRVGDAADTRYFEIPLVIQDKSFEEDGALHYPPTREEYDQYPGPYIPDSPVPPIWGPEFIGDVMLVNGRSWPFHEVEPRLYRLRLLNASDARTLILGFDRPVELIQIGGDGGFMPLAPVRESQLVLGPAERADVLVDFSQFAPGDTITMTNTGPDEPWGGPDAGQAPADPNTTGQVMQFRVVSATNAGIPGAVPTALPALAALTPTAPPRDLVLVEGAVSAGGNDYPIHVELGTVADGPLPWAAPPTEVIELGATEVWRVANTTDDAHPIHIHLIDFQILDRIPFDADAFRDAQEAWLAGTGPEPQLDAFITGSPMPPAAYETSEKDTVIMMPGTITRLIGHFDRTGSYVWHCHITEHEDNDMMRPLVIEP